MNVNYTIKVIVLCSYVFLKLNCILNAFYIFNKKMLKVGKYRSMLRDSFAATNNKF